jgi:hypothetical protein
MDHLFVDLPDSIQRDSSSLLDRERMVCRFQFHERTDPIIAQVNHGLQIHGLRIDPDVRAKPTKERAVMISFGHAMQLLKVQEVFLAQGRPYPPREGLLLSSYRHFETPTDKEELVVDHASVSSKEAATLPLVFWDLQVLKWA